MKKQKKLFIGIIIAVLLVALASLIGIRTYSAQTLATLRNQDVYTSPEEGMRDLVSKHYSGIDKIEIIHSDNEILDNLWFVEARVWAKSRSDGKAMTGKEYDNPGNFFLRVDNGWVNVPESKRPLLTAVGKWIFDLNK